MRKAEHLRTNPDQPLKFPISGAPGIGKTSLVNMIARTLASHPASIEHVNDKEAGLELAREWTRSLAYGLIFGSWSVKVITEMDRCSKDAQNISLTSLDRMKPTHAFLGTTNLDLLSLTERFQTRFQAVLLQPPENEVLAAFLARRWLAPIATTRMIATGGSRKRQGGDCGFGDVVGVKVVGRACDRTSKQRKGFVTRSPSTSLIPVAHLQPRSTIENFSRPLRGDFGLARRNFAMRRKCYDSKVTPIPPTSINYLSGNSISLQSETNGRGAPLK